MSSYIHPCGYQDDGPEEEAWKCEIVCLTCGCKDCKHFDGMEHFIKNIPKAVAIWAKRERELLNRGR